MIKPPNRTPEECRFASDVYLDAARHYYYMEGDDSGSNKLLWRAAIWATWANILEEE